MTSTGDGDARPGGHGRIPLWLALLWALFLVWMVVYVVTGLSQPLG